MKKLIIPVIILILTRCSGPDAVTPLAPEPEDPLKDLPDLGPMRFDNPAIGQRSYYIRFDAQHNFQTGDVTITANTDTLVVAITDNDSDRWTLTEFLTPGSTSREEPYEPFVNILKVDSDSVYFISDYDKSGISFVFGGGRRALPLALISDPSPINPDILPSFEYTTTIFTKYTVNYTRGGKTFNHLNNFFDYREMAGDGLGLMYVYGSPYGLVRWTWISAWSVDRAEGWDLLNR